jgi:hypothetical protein
MKGEVIMFNFKNAKTNAMNKVGAHSTFITFIFATIGVAATAYLASKEIPKAKAEIKTVLEKEGLTKTQKATETVKVAAKSTWKTFAVAVGTILLVTGTAAVSTANAATTVAGLTSALNLAETKLKDTTEAINDIPDKKVKEETQRAVTQKMVSRATAGMRESEFLPDESCPDKYIWVSKFDGVKFKATFQMVESLEDIVDARITNRGYITIEGVYDILVSLGAEILTDEYPDVDSMFGWNGGFELTHSVTMNENGYTIHYIDFSEPTKDF